MNNPNTPQDFYTYAVPLSNGSWEIGVACKGDEPLKNKNMFVEKHFHRERAVAMKERVLNIATNRKFKIEGSCVHCSDTEALLLWTAAHNPKKPKRPVEPNGYTKDWEEVTNTYRTAQRWTCEACGLYLGEYDHRGLLHTHHINRDTSNNDDENLQALCALCHRAEHRKVPETWDLVKVESGEEETILELSKRQGVRAGESQSKPSTSPTPKPSIPEPITRSVTRGRLRTQMPGHRDTGSDLEEERYNRDPDEGTPRHKRERPWGYGPEETDPEYGVQKPRRR